MLFLIPHKKFYHGNFIESKPPFLLTWLVTIAALLRRYSPSPHRLLMLLSHVSNLASIN